MDAEPTTTEAPPSTTDRVADAVSVASDFGAIWVAVSVVQVLTGRSSARAAVRRLGAAGVLSLVLTRWLKHRYAVPREGGPSSTTLARTPRSPTFPSGHTLAAFVSALVIPTGNRGRQAAVLLAALVAWARVRVGHHRPVDVAAGAAVGGVAGALLAALLAPRAGGRG
ncbi:MAG TPA: phosphatase PAP2 family protein [Acidimicrobiales bacterium]|jgi:undecaprenyl-diphosphatase